MAAIILIVGVLALGLTAVRFIRHRLAYAVTDAVFIRTDSLVNLGFDGVNGRIAAMNVNEGEEVSAGEQLATIDDRQYRLTVTRLEAELAEAQRGLAGRKLSRTRLAEETRLNVEIASDQVTQLQAEKAGIEAKIAGMAAEIALLEKDRTRYTDLAKAQAVAARKVEDVATELTARREEQNALVKQAVALDAALLGAGRKIELAGTNRLLIKETDEDIAALTQKIAALVASLEQARDMLGKCTLKSPIAGRVARRFTSPGDVVEPESDRIRPG